MTHKEWETLIAKEFNVSNSVAKEMYHQMSETYELKKASMEYRKIMEASRNKNHRADYER